MVARLDGGNALADGLDDSSAFVTEDNGEGTLGVFSTECVGIWYGVSTRDLKWLKNDMLPVWQTPV